MAHNFESGFFVKTPAWHSLGTVLENPPSIDEALKLAGLDWTVSTRPMSAEINGNGSEPVADFKLMIRDSDHSQLGVVGAKYEPIQNAKALEPFQPLVESGLVTLDAAGSLRDGRRVWILGKIVGADCDILPGDSVRGYVVFYTSHDGSLRTAYQRTAIRVVCDNTISAAEEAGKGKEKESRILVRHTGDVNGRIDRIKDQFQLAIQKFQEDMETFKLIAARPLESDEALDAYFNAVLRTKERKEKASAAQVLGLAGATADIAIIEPGKRQLEQLKEIFETQPGAEFGRGTYWQAYNAITFWLDHERGRNEANRLNASWFGDGQSIRDRALKLALGKKQEDESEGE